MVASCPVIFVHVGPMIPSIDFFCGHSFFTSRKANSVYFKKAWISSVRIFTFYVFAQICHCCSTVTSGQIKFEGFWNSLTDAKVGSEHRSQAKIFCLELLLVLWKCITLNFQPEFNLSCEHTVFPYQYYLSFPLRKYDFFSLSKTV